MASPIPLEYAGTVRAWMCGVCGHVHAHDDRGDYQRGADEVEAQRADQGLRAASDRAAVEEALAAFRRGAETATIAERRALVRAVVEAAVLRDESLALDLRVTVRTVTAPGAAAASWTGAPVKLGRLRVAVPRPERRRAA